MNIKLPMCLLNWINSDKIEWGWLSMNPSEGAMNLLENNPNKIDWG